MILKRFFYAIKANYFKPGCLGIFTNPFYFARKGLDRNIRKLAPSLNGKILDVGCGASPYKEHFNCTSYIGLEIAGRDKKTDLLYDGINIPFRDEEIDSVLTTQVLEHVISPDELLSEISRVLKSDGVLLLTVPFAWNEHEQPHDYYRYTANGIANLLNKHGFEVIACVKSMNDIRAIFQLLILYIFSRFKTMNRYIRFAMTLLMISPLNITGEVLSLLLPSNNDFYLDNVILAIKSQKKG